MVVESFGTCRNDHYPARFNDVFYVADDFFPVSNMFQHFSANQEIEFIKPKSLDEIFSRADFINARSCDNIHPYILSWLMGFRKRSQGSINVPCADFDDRLPCNIRLLNGCLPKVYAMLMAHGRSPLDESGLNCFAVFETFVQNVSIDNFNDLRVGQFEIRPNMFPSLKGLAGFFDRHEKSLRHVPLAGKDV